MTMYQYRNGQCNRRHRNCSLSSSFTTLIGFVALVYSTSCLVNAQIGTTICVCSPAVYEIQLSFSQTCNNTALIGDGITASDCAIEPFQSANVSDLVPVSASSIDILELDTDLVLLTQSSRFGTFGDGDVIRFASISNDPSMLNDTFYPKAIQISVIGSNVLGETLFYAGLIVYDTECGQYPLIEAGSSVGWITFTELEDPSRTICPLAFTKAPSSTLAPASVAPAPTVPITPPSTPSTPVQPPTNVPRSTKLPSNIPAPIIRSTKAPAQIVPPKTKPPHCYEGGKGKSSKSEKGMGKGKGMKKGMSMDSEKGNGKGKGKGMGMGKGKGKGSNIFDHDECSDVPSITISPAPTTEHFGKGGKGKGSDPDDDDYSNSVKVPPVPIGFHPSIPAIPTPVPPSMDIGSGDDASSGDGTGTPTDTSADSEDNASSNSSDDDRIYTNSGLSWNTNSASQGALSGASSGQIMGYSVLLVLACVIGIACAIIVYRQNFRASNTNSRNHINNKFSWIRWGIMIDDENDNYSSTTTMSKQPQPQQKQQSTRKKQKSASSSSLSSSSEKEYLTAKFRNEI